jgi:hypothetical protein
MQITAVVHASQVLTAAANAGNTETVTVGGKTYTFQTTLTNVDGNVDIGADAEESLANLKAAINLEAGAGTKYAAATTANAHVVATGVTATALTVKAKVPGTTGNFIPSTETAAQLSWGAATLAGGTGNISTAISEILAGAQLNAEVAQALKKLDGTPASQ